MNDIVLLPRFSRKVELHLVSCYSNAPRWPIILGIFGRSGDGKSVQLTAALQKCNVEIIRLNAADLESGLAGEPGKHIARTYSVASLAINKEIPTALIVDDVDTTVGEWEMNTGTVNHQQVLAELMHLADEPVDKVRNFPCRVPVFLTGNNLRRLYPPLRRPGRMDTFVWRPDPLEVREVAAAIFADLSDAGTINRLISEFAGEPLAFFGQVRRALLQLEMSEYLSDGGYDMKNYLRRSRGNPHNGRRRRVMEHELVQAARDAHAQYQAALEDFLADGGRSAR
jgi:hypothetical protein